MEHGFKESMGSISQMISTRECIEIYAFYAYYERITPQFTTLSQNKVTNISLHPSSTYFLTLHCILDRQLCALELLHSTIAKGSN